MVDMIKRVYPTESLEEHVAPPVELGFLRKQLQKKAPNEGCSLDELI